VLGGGDALGVVAHYFRRRYVVSYVGKPSDEYRAVCVYSDRPGAPKCGSPATRHVAVEDAHYGAVALATCSTHLPAAKAAGPVMGEHDFEGFCGFPGSLWSSERCVLDGSGPDRTFNARTVALSDSAL
jgi:hypothetical protein